jgi:hypothetical protein
VLQNENSASAVKFWLVRFKITIGDYWDVVPWERFSATRNGFRWFCGAIDGSKILYAYRSVDTKAYLKGMKNILMSQKSVLRVVNYEKRQYKSSG